MNRRSSEDSYFDNHNWCCRIQDGDTLDELNKVFYHPDFWDKATAAYFVTETGDYTDVWLAEHQLGTYYKAHRKTDEQIHDELMKEIITALDEYIWDELYWALPDVTNLSELVTAIANNEYFVVQSEDYGEFKPFIAINTLKLMGYVPVYDDDDEVLWILNPDVYDEWGNLWNDPALYERMLI